ncbi:MAG: septum formation protein Maf [Bdellovibrionaceae bacterium]|nr:septum formation protein Maf [Bdellovibrio sp.]
MKQLILASQSPRRSEILKNAGFQFVSFPVHVSEIPNKNLILDEQIIDIARRKAKACEILALAQGLDGVVLSADTMVCLGSETLGKPENEQIAFEYLTKLSGKSHQVKTAVYLIDLNTKDEVSHLETTDVFFRELSEKEILNYIATKEPADKAGAYAIQGEGRQFVQKYVGDFDNVVGLPLQALQKLFKLKAWNFLKLQPEP